ncbi:hypothetical protein ACHAWF_015151 [Thalassiosira exigua]
MTRTKEADASAPPDPTPAVVMTSIGRGDMDMVMVEPDPPRRPSWSDVRALMDRVEALESERRRRRRPEAAADAEEGAALIERTARADASDSADEDAKEEEDAPSPSRRRLTESQIEVLHDNYAFPESTYTFLTTEGVASAPSAVAILTSAFCMLCLVLAFKNEQDNAEEGNPLGIVAGVQLPVKVAQYCAQFHNMYTKRGNMSVNMKKPEATEGLELIGKAVEQDISGGNRFSIPRIVLPSLLRLATGYLFLLCMFLTVVQESTVLDIFFDILALEVRLHCRGFLSASKFPRLTVRHFNSALKFVEKIDDVIFELSKRGLQVAANNEHHIECSRQSHTCRKWTKRFIRSIYIFNIALGIGALVYFSEEQKAGAYRCNSVTVSFGDAIWEDAYVKNGDKMEKRLLIFSHFNGIYVEEETDGDRPRYVERNKEDGDRFIKQIPAEIMYCDEIESWVFNHPDIKTSNPKESSTTENDCSWLLRSPSTDSYDITELAEDEEWFVWTGLIESDYRISIECNECTGNAGCNYNGECINSESGLKTCDCFDEFFGSHCQFKQPCPVIRSEKDTAATLDLLGDPNDEEGEDFVEVYGRPMYVRSNMTGKPLEFLRLTYPDDDGEHFDIEYQNSTVPNDVQVLVPHKHNAPEFFTDDDFFEQNNQTAEYAKLLQNYTFIIFYTGRRWYGQIIPPGLTATGFDEEEYHAFWANTFSGLGEQDNRTVIISAPTDRGSPVGVDFYEMRRRNIAFETGDFDYNYDPYGVDIPLTEYEGTGFFHCNRVD